MSDLLDRLRSLQGFLEGTVAALRGPARATLEPTLAAFRRRRACVRPLRHSFGTQAADAQVPLHVIQKILGHRSLQTTTIYVQAKKQRMMREAADYYAARKTREEGAGAATSDERTSRKRETSFEPVKCFFLRDSAARHRADVSCRLRSRRAICRGKALYRVRRQHRCV
ncbi:hypothetical protein C9I57_30290 [Trinickia symbiotica]|uniref:Tyr recombinase domain-containing protein n=1 Tax=Trinickia symbiotica TaxID=863227 RepID=A0A2T3XKD8_9BURK|nr:tyrosine-type recombinase/integrase [Trinickia symbiotica]PTB16996.1 hypothetical protein C9I57_30290 [Trinickia symbiotica]